MLPEKEKIWSYNTFSKILDRFGKTLIGWLCTGLLSTDFRIEGKIDELIDLFAQPKMKEEKKSTFCFKISVGISMNWMLYSCLNSSSPFLRHWFERKTEFAFFEEGFNTWMILVFRYCG